jgi:cytochrome c553
MRIFVGMIAAMVVAIPALTMAGEGDPGAGKARAASAGCLACHGTNGVAITEITPNLAAEPALFTEFQLVFFRSGVRKNNIMNAMAKPLSDADVYNLGAFFASLPAPDLPLPPDPDPGQTALGEKVAQAIHCTSCHGDHYEGVDNIARLAGQREDYLLKALRDFKSGVRTGTGINAMVDVVYPLGDTEMKALAHYLSRLR